MIKAGISINAVTADDWQNAIYPWDLLMMNQRLLKHLPAAREGTPAAMPLSTGRSTSGQARPLVRIR